VSERCQALVWVEMRIAWSLALELGKPKPLASYIGNLRRSQNPPQIPPTFCSRLEVTARPNEPDQPAKRPERHREKVDRAGYQDDGRARGQVRTIGEQKPGIAGKDCSRNRNQHHPGYLARPKP